MNAGLNVATGHNLWKSVSVGDGVPPELAKYGNGRIPTNALESIGIGEHRMWSPAAEAFTAMRGAASADGVSIGVTDSYRSYDQQVDLARRKGLYKDGGLGAVPGTSEHGWGRAVDVDVNGAGLAWMRSHAAQFGFTEDTPREPWHWGFQGVAAATV
jgi:LAS superfamily LD-carboxypeptidase LdcB